jgi:hypothetical protein
MDKQPEETAQHANLLWLQGLAKITKLAGLSMHVHGVTSFVTGMDCLIHHVLHARRNVRCYVRNRDIVSIA